MREYHVLNLGAGVQSTAIYLMVATGYIDDISLDCAIFADTGDEPEAVYSHLQWLQSIDGPEIIVAKNAMSLGDNLMQSDEGDSKPRFSSIPAFTAFKPGEPMAITRRHCTHDYKVEAIERTIRRNLLGLKPRQRIPKDVHVHQYMGFSFDEPGRASRAQSRWRDIPWGSVHFPLFDDLMKRSDCVQWLDTHGNVPHEVPRSACTFCPFHSNLEWRRVKKNPVDWERACEVDDALRVKGNSVNRGLEAELYVHKSCRPLRDVDLDDNQKSLFDMECEGGCGL